MTLACKVTTTLHRFNVNVPAGVILKAVPFAALIQATDGNLYSTTAQGGATNQGPSFRMTLGGNLNPVYSLRASGGANPYRALVQATDGNLYGVTRLGGDGEVDMVFMLSSALAHS